MSIFILYFSKKIIHFANILLIILAIRYNIDLEGVILLDASFGSRLRELRKNMELTQTELGKQFNVSDVAISKWEADERFPAKEILIRIADFFDVSIDYLLCRTDYPKSIVHEDAINDHTVRIDYDKNVYPDGLTHEQVLEILKAFKAAGFIIKKDDKA